MSGVNLSLFSVSPHPAPSPKDNSNMSMLYTGLAMVGIAAIVLVLYNLIIVKMCRRRHHMQSSQVEGPNGIVEVVTGSSMSFENSQRNLLSSFKYKKEVGKGGGDDYECPICLSILEEGEEVRKLPKCNHCFHVECIDMWLHSHMDCPVCRTHVGNFCHRFTLENSLQGLLESGGVSV